MSFTLEQFIETRPFAYHFTSHENQGMIQATRRLESARSLLGQDGVRTLIQEKRKTRKPALVNGEEVYLQNQSPLYEGNICFQGGWDFEDLLAELSGLVFSWPGGESPIRYGENYVQSTRWEQPLFGLKIPMVNLLKDNQSPLFCRYNSGSPRCSGGRKSPRGPKTFLPCSEFPGTPGEVVELTFRECVNLPSSTLFRTNSLSPWSKFFEEDILPIMPIK